MADEMRLPLSRFRAIAARYVLETADGVVLVKAADALLDAGIYTWSVGELATTLEPPVRDVRRLFEMSLKELGIPLPSPEDAARILARWHLYGVIEGGVAPFHALMHLRDELSYPLRFDRRLSNIEPQLRFINRRYDYEYLHEMAEEGYSSREGVEREEAALDRQFLVDARSWLCRDGPRLIDPRWLSWKGGIVRRLAQAISDERVWDRLPILADALEEAGCNNAELIEHCRAGAPHKECCWIIDILLLKEMGKST